MRIEHFGSDAAELSADLEICQEDDVTNKSLIEVIQNGRESTIVIFWSHFSESASLGIHYSENDNVLFLGGGSVSAVVDVAKLQILNINYPMLFWGWQLVNDYILELGELECRLFTSKGKLVGEAPVDPPYSFNVTDHRIEFTSIVMGNTSIVY